MSCSTGSEAERRLCNLGFHAVGSSTALQVQVHRILLSCWLSCRHNNNKRINSPNRFHSRQNLTLSLVRGAFLPPFQLFAVRRASCAQSECTGETPTRVARKFPLFLPEQTFALLDLLRAAPNQLGPQIPVVCPLLLPPTDLADGCASRQQRQSLSASASAQALASLTSLSCVRLAARRFGRL